MLAADETGLLVGSRRPKPRFTADEDIVRFDLRAIHQEADDFADIGIFQKNKLVGIARRIGIGWRKIGGAEHVLALRPDGAAANFFFGAHPLYFDLNGIGADIFGRNAGWHSCVKPHQQAAFRREEQSFTDQSAQSLSLRNPARLHG